MLKSFTIVQIAQPAKGFSRYRATCISKHDTTDNASCRR